MNDVLAYYLKNAPKVFNDNKKKFNKMLMMRGQSCSSTPIRAQQKATRGGSALRSGEQPLAVEGSLLNISSS